MDVSIGDLDNFKVKQLKDFLRSRGEQVTGSKSELIEHAKGVLLLKKQPLSDIKHRDEKFDNQRLVEKLVSPLGEKLPDQASITFCNKDVSVIPSVNDNELYNFLVLNNNRTHDSRQSGAKRQLKAKVFYEDRHVHSISSNVIDENCSHCFVKCLVLPSLPTDTTSKKPDYQVWVCLSKVTGRIHSASCTCTAGYPHLGAGPDGYVYCECEDCTEPQGLLEIRCPFKYRTLTHEEAAKEKDFCCALVDGAVRLKTDHIYFYQLQAQMAICLRPWCDFVIWTCKGMTVQRIEYDYLFWETSMLPRINKFYVKGVIPELFSSRVKRCKPLFT